MDAQVADFSVEQTGQRRWPLVNFFYTLDCAIYNARALFNSAMAREAARGRDANFGRTSVKFFCRLLIDEMIRDFAEPEVEEPPEPAPAPSKRPLSCQPRVMEPDEDGFVARLTCVVCKSKGKMNRTRYECATCCVPLCDRSLRTGMRECFAEFHAHRDNFRYKRRKVPARRKAVVGK